MNEHSLSDINLALDSCQRPPVGPHKKIIILGNPNVGKSLLFNHLTGHYATVANYPGTTVEISRGKMEREGVKLEILDTPGMYSFLAISEEEKVARDILFHEDTSLVIHVVDAKNLEHMLPLTLQLIEKSFPVLLVLNMMDEARELGIEINLKRLAIELNTPVLGTVLTNSEGLHELKEMIFDLASRNVSAEPRKENREPTISEAFEVATRFKSLSSQISRRVYRIKDQKNQAGSKKVHFSEFLSRLTTSPITGFPILFLILYLGIYQFVGVFGAGVVVNFLEKTIFEEKLNPFFQHVFQILIPWPVLQDLFVGEYGILTQGMRYAVALILPIVSFYFTVFAVIEDTGYLPRLAMLMDRGLKKMGMSGRAVIPLVLGLGCDTMATVVTRTLPTARERIISTFLLALAIPCSAQLGVIFAVLGGHPALFLIWLLVIVKVFLAAGFLASKVLPGEQPSFYMELPPLRLPKISHVFTKTYVRVKWYFQEVLPLFVVASALIWFGQLTGILGFLSRLLTFPVRLIGLPDQAATIFLMGFFRRDYGAAGLYDLVRAGRLTDVQIVVASVALTLFLPCIAQFLINMKERGLKAGLAISLFVLGISFGIAYVLNLILSIWGIQI